MKIVTGEGIQDKPKIPQPTARKFPNFLKAYLEYTSNLEATDKLNLWTAISTVAGALERKVYLERSHFKIFPNLYVVVIGPAGLIKKTTATSIGVGLLRDLPNIRMLAQRVTDAALAEALRRSGDKYLDNGKEVRQSALYCYASELTTLLKDTHGVVVEYLTDLFDCAPHDSTKPWVRETKGEGQVKIYGPCVNILSCATPTSIRECIPVSQMEAGFASRVLFVVEPNPPTKFVAIPRKDPKLEAMRNDLLNDLTIIHQLTGEMTMTAEAEEFFEDWYAKHKTDIHGRGDDARFAGYYGRKDLMVQKLSITASVVETSDLVIRKQHIIAGIRWLEMLEENMFKLFHFVGRNENASALIDLLNYVRKEGRVLEPILKTKFLRDLDPDAVGIMIKNLVQMGQLVYHNEGSVGYYTVNLNAPDLSGWKDNKSKEEDINY